jgi:hypothetical protein
MQPPRFGTPTPALLESLKHPPSALTALRVLERDVLSACPQWPEHLGPEERRQRRRESDPWVAVLVVINRAEWAARQALTDLQQPTQRRATFAAFCTERLGGMAFEAARAAGCGDSATIREILDYAERLCTQLTITLYAHRMRQLHPRASHGDKFPSGRRRGAVSALHRELLEILSREPGLANREIRLRLDGRAGRTGCVIQIYHPLITRGFTQVHGPEVVEWRNDQGKVRKTCWSTVIRDHLPRVRKQLPSKGNSSVRV